jgi:acetyltransferase-like isoleucine patch superfamily enzyme
MHHYERYRLREIPLPPATEAMYARFLSLIEDKIAAGVDGNLICREALKLCWEGGSLDVLAALTPKSDTAPWTNDLLRAHFDPRNVTLEAERYGDADPAKYAKNKPLIWLWYGFDRSPLGMNLELGFRLRRLLAKHIFKSCGKNLKVFPYVELAFGYNMEVGDDVVIHRWVNLDDRAGIVLGDRSSLSDFVNVYSHTHDINEQELVANIATVIEADCRITYHATILAGSRVRRGSMVGANAMLTGKEIPRGEVWIGLPAKKAKDKDYFVDKPTGEKWTTARLKEE